MHFDPTVGRKSKLKAKLQVVSLFPVNLHFPLLWKTGWLEKSDTTRNFAFSFDFLLTVVTESLNKEGKNKLWTNCVMLIETRAKPGEIAREEWCSALLPPRTLCWDHGKIYLFEFDWCYSVVNAFWVKSIVSLSTLPAGGSPLCIAVSSQMNRDTPLTKAKNRAVHLLRHALIAVVLMATYIFSYYFPVPITWWLDIEIPT